ncbi:MAG TPA: DnaJ domain-containing protein [Luteimonas sp.]|nr:DnaJ domain-containing protein [Luteimonas sp.]
MIQAGEALEWALALQQTPSRRAMVRAQPLPSDLTELLSIAGGSVASLESAARRVGVSEPAVLDAARFFVQQAMLFDGADAYRVLGVARSAHASRIRDHHRLLLRWLHPDRSSGGQWDSAFSGRVNWAWNLLRTDAQRAAYDRTLVDATAAAPAFADGLPQAPVPALRAVHTRGGATPRTGRLAPLAVLLVTLGCIALALVAVRREGELDRLRDADIAPGETAYAAPTAQRAQALARAPQDLDAMRRAATGLLPRDPLGAAPNPSSARAPVDADMGLMATAAASAAAPDGEERPDQGARAGSVETNQVASTAEQTAGLPPLSGGPRQTLAWARPGGNLSDPATELSPSAPAVRRRDQPVPLPEPDRRLATSRMQPAEAQPTNPATQAATLVEAARNDPAPAAAIDDETDPLRLMQQAQARVRSVTRYLVATAPPPAWADATARGAGDGIREDMRTRLAGQRAHDLLLLAPQWRLDTTHAAVRSRYSVAGRGGAIEEGELAIDLARRDGQWQVASLRLVPAL